MREWITTGAHVVIAVATVCAVIAAVWIARRQDKCSQRVPARRWR
jgi:hypothetical protein